MRDSIKWFYVMKDHLGSIREVFTKSGAVNSRYDYDVYGKLDSATESTVSPYKFTGQEYDVQSGLYNFRARLYDSDLGMFYAVDPVRSTNSPYGYGKNNPISYVDPTGMNDLLGTLQDKMREAARAEMEEELARRKARDMARMMGVSTDPFLDAEWGGYDMGGGWTDWQTDGFMTGSWNGLSGYGYKNNGRFEGVGGAGSTPTGEGGRNVSIYVRGATVSVDYEANGQVYHFEWDEPGHWTTVWVPDGQNTSTNNTSSIMEAIATALGISASTVEGIMKVGRKFATEAEDIKDLVKVGDVAKVAGRFTGLVSAASRWDQFSKTSDTGDFLDAYFSTALVFTGPFVGLVTGLADVSGVSGDIYHGAGQIIDYYTGKRR